MQRYTAVRGKRTGTMTRTSSAPPADEPDIFAIGMDLVECTDTGAQPVRGNTAERVDEEAEEEEEGDSDEENMVWQDEWPQDVQEGEAVWVVTTSNLPLETTQQEWEDSFSGPEFEGKLRQQREP